MPPSSSWFAFKSVAPSSRKQKAAASARDLKKSVDLCSLEVVNNRLQLGDVRSTTCIRVAENDVCLSNMTDLVQARFQSVMPLDDRILLVDNRAVPFADDEGTRGTTYLLLILLNLHARLHACLNADL